MLHYYKKAYKEKEEYFEPFLFFNTAFMGLIRNYWTWKVKKKIELIESTHPVQNYMLVLINFNIPLGT